MPKKNRSSKKKSTFHKKYKKHVKSLSKSLGKSISEVESILSSKFNDVVKSITPKKMSKMSKKKIQKHSISDLHLPHEFDNSLTFRPIRNKCNKCNKCNNGRGKCGKGKCKSCGKMKLPLSLMRNMRSMRKPMNKRTFYLTPKALRHDNIKTNMSGFSETKVCESHNGSPLKCRTMRKRY